MSEHEDAAEVEDWEYDAEGFEEPSPKTPSRDRRPILFEPSRRATNPMLKAGIETLIADLESVEVELHLRQRKRRPADRESFRLAVEALTCNALVVALYGDDQLLAVPRANGTMWGSEGRGERVYGQHFLDALALFTRPDVSLAEDVARGYSYSGSKGSLSTIRVLPRLRKVLGVGPYDWDSLRRDEAGREVLLLRDAKQGASAGGGGQGKAKAKNIEFPETDQTARLRAEVQSLNAWLAAAPLVLADGHKGPLRSREDQPIDPAKRSLQRIFNNASWHEGGRLFGGFWQEMPRRARPYHLLIASDYYPDGEPTVSVDYGQLFAHLAYHESGMAPPGGDLYWVFDGDFALGEQRHRIRAGVKRVFNALLFTRGDLTRWPRDTAPLFPKGTKLATVRNAIYARHPALRHLFGSGIGFRLMFNESQILIAVLKDLQSQGVYALPIHDAVIVALSDRDAAKSAMTSGILKTMGVDLNVKIEVFEAVAS